MSHYAMTVLAAVPFLLVLQGKQAQSPKDIISVKYKQYSTAYSKNDRSGIEGWIRTNLGSAFTYTSYHKTKYSREGFRMSVLQDMENTSKVINANLIIRSVDVKGDQATAIVASTFKGTVNIDSRRFTLTNASVESDTWSKIGKDWKLTKRIQVNNDMQLQPGD